MQRATIRRGACSPVSVDTFNAKVCTRASPTLCPTREGTRRVARVTVRRRPRFSAAPLHEFGVPAPPQIFERSRHAPEMGFPGQPLRP